MREEKKTREFFDKFLIILFIYFTSIKLVFLLNEKKKIFWNTYLHVPPVPPVRVVYLNLLRLPNFMNSNVLILKNLNDIWRRVMPIAKCEQCQQTQFVYFFLRFAHLICMGFNFMSSKMMRYCVCTYYYFLSSTAVIVL